MDEKVLETLDDSLRRCSADPAFLDRFYEIFLGSSPKVREKFANTDFVRQKRALRASLHLILLAAGDEKDGPERYLKNLAVTHSAKHLNIGAELYDLWLDSLIQTVREFDTRFDAEIEDAWEQVMGFGIAYLLAHYHHPPQ